MGGGRKKKDDAAAKFQILNFSGQDRSCNLANAVNQLGPRKTGNACDYEKKVMMMSHLIAFGT